MTLYEIKPAFQAMLRPIMLWLYKHRITANYITIFAMFLSFATGIIFIVIPRVEIFALLPIVLFIRMALNALDGMLARECNQETRLGAILNETGDVLSDMALYFPFMFLPHTNMLLVIFMLFCIIMTEFCGILVQTINGIRSYHGPLGKSDRALVFGIWGLLIAIWPSLLQWNNILWSIACILLVFTIINRCRSAL